VRDRLGFEAPAFLPLANLFCPCFFIFRQVFGNLVLRFPENASETRRYGRAQRAFRLTNEISI
jgi:hypothetical protein